MSFIVFLPTLRVRRWEVMKHIFLVLPGARPGPQFDLRNTAVLQSQTAWQNWVLVLSAWPNTNYNMRHGAMLLMGKDKQCISGRKIMGFNHTKISQAHSSFSTSYPPQVKTQYSYETNYFWFITELPNQIFGSDKVIRFGTHPEILLPIMSIFPQGMILNKHTKISICVSDRCLSCVRHDPRNSAGSCERLSQTN